MKDKKSRQLIKKQERYLFTFALDGFIGGENVEFFNGLNSLRFVFDYRGMASVKIIFKEEGKQRHLVVPMCLFREIAGYLPPMENNMYEDHNEPN
ncbi:MAG: hypothetical protein JKY03_13285 [Aureispira sp.]|nr:hypothetical protein [Aureispira sp.]